MLTDECPRSSAIVRSGVPSIATAANEPNRPLSGHRDTFFGVPGVNRTGLEAHIVKARLDGVIEVSGPELAASLADLGLVDEYRIYLHPVAIGGGKPFFARPRGPLRLVATDRIGDEVIRLTYVPG